MRRRHPLAPPPRGSPWSRDAAVLERCPAHADSWPSAPASLDLLARLDADRREAFVLTQLLGLPYAEAADVAGCPVGTIRSRVARARADLVDALSDGADESAASS